MPIHCSDCGEIIHGIPHNHIEGEPICDECFEHYYRCDGCGDYVHEGDVYFDDDNDAPYCHCCYTSRRREILGYHEFDSDDYVKHGDSHNNSVPYLGIELEIDHGNGENDNIAAQAKEIMKDFVHMEYDGSLTSGFENITQPATLEYHTTLKKQYKAMLKLYIKNGYRSHNTSTCGLHVHLNRDFFSHRSHREEDLCITRLLYFFEKFWDNLQKFSRRNISELSRWCRKANDSPEEFLKKAKRHDIGRYEAINLSNDETIEFRIFRGTLRYETFIATLQLIDSMARKAKTISNEELQSVQWEDFLEHDEIRAYWETVKDRVSR